MKRGERKDGGIVKHCNVRIASSWSHCPICGKKKTVQMVVTWS